MDENRFTDIMTHPKIQSFAEGRGYYHFSVFNDPRSLLELGLIANFSQENLQILLEHDYRLSTTPAALQWIAQHCVNPSCEN